MKLKNNIVAVAFGLLALTSCASVNTTENSNSLYNKNNNHEDSKVKLEVAPISELFNRFFSAKVNNRSLLNVLDSNDFSLEGLDYMYEGEEILLDQPIYDNLRAIKLISKNPVRVLKEGDSDYSKYQDEENKYSVEENDGKKTVTFLDQKTVYVVLQDTNSGETKEVMLYNPIEVKTEIPRVPDGTSYSDLKKTFGNRLVLEVNTHEDGYEDKNYKDLKGAEKYEDLDDLSGKKRVLIRNNINNESYYATIDFGTKLSDFSGKYEDLLVDLSKQTLKYSEDGSEVTGGFNPDLVKKITEYEKKSNNDDIQFVTEVLDKDKKSIGNHKIARKIIKNGTVIFEKVENTHITFSGTSVAIADSAFYDIEPDLEARMIRYFSHGLEHAEKTKFTKFDRPHGSFVVGSMIDEVVQGNARFINRLINQNTRFLRQLTILGKNRDFTTYSFITNDSDFNRGLNNLYLQLLTEVSSGGIQEDDLFLGKLSKIGKKIKEFKEGGIEEQANQLSGEEKDKFLSNYYDELLYLIEDYVAISEKEKLKLSDLHFYSISLDNEDGNLDTSRVSKYLPRILDDNKNIKAVNMSYGSEGSVEEYIALKALTDEDFEKLAQEYNTNENFRTAILNYLYAEDTRSINRRREYGGEVYIPTMYEYYKDKSTITKEDYKKIVDLKLLDLSYRLSSSSELVNANRDVLFVVAQGNTRNNSSVTDVDLYSYDNLGRKVVYLDGDKKYNNPFAGLPTYLNIKEKERAIREDRKFKYNPTYRKNILGVVGLMTKKLTTISKDATDNISDDWVINTSDALRAKSLYFYVRSQFEYYNSLLSRLDEAEKNPGKYSDRYVSDIKVQIQSIENLAKLSKDFNDRDFKFSFTRAGKSKLWVVAAEGNISYVRALSDEEKKLFEPGKYDDVLGFHHFGINPLVQGSSFAAPRITAIVGEIGTRFPWMSAHQIKQSILTTADDDHRVITIPAREANAETGTEASPERRQRVGLYGPDENIGWGISNKERAYRGPGRFVKALVRETGDEDFVANIPYGTYEFGNSIEGAFDPYLYMVSRGLLNELEFTMLYQTKDYTPEYVLSEEFDTNEETKPLADILKQLNIPKTRIYTDYQPKVDKYLASLDEEEKDLFVGAGLVKKGKGTLILSGLNTYEDPTVIEEGTLVIKGTSKSPSVIHKGAKLKLDLAEVQSLVRLARDDETFESSLSADVYNFGGELYSYSGADRIKAKYVPYNGSKTYISALSNLQIDELDLTNTTKFDFDVFRKKGMLVFPEAPSSPRDSDEITSSEAENIVNQNVDEKVVLTINKVSKNDLYKVKLGKYKYSALIDLLVEEKEIEGDTKNVSLVGKLLRKDASEVEVGNTASEILSLLNTEDKNDTSWMSTDELKTLNGKALANSLLVGYEVSELKNDILSKILNSDLSKDKTGVFFNYLNRSKFRSSVEGDKFINTNGILLGLQKSLGDFRLGLSLNYANTLLDSYTLSLKEYDEDYNHEDPVATAHALEQAGITSGEGKVFANTFGASLLGKYEKNNGYLNTIANFDYIAKSVQRKVLDRETKEVNSSDALFNLNLEGGYKVKYDKFTFTPFVGLNSVLYLRGEFNEDLDFGYKGDNELSFKSDFTIGSRFEYKVTKDLNLSAMLSYSKYLTDPYLKSNVELNKYKFEKDIKGVKLDDHRVKYGFDVNYKINNAELNFGYQGNGLFKHFFNLLVKYEF